MFSAFVLIKLSVFLQIFTQIQSHSSYFVKIQSGYSNFHSNNHFFALVLKNLSKPRNFYASAICDKFHVWLSIPWNGILIEKKSFYISIMLGWEHTSYLSRTRGRCPCKFFLAGVNFYRFNTKNWQFSVYFAVRTQKIGNLLCILS